MLLFNKTDVIDLNLVHRPRLKGTEAEIAAELGTKWETITFNWKESENRSIE